MAKVAHRRLGVALGEGQKLVQWCWLVLRHSSNSAGTAMAEQAHLALIPLQPQSLSLRTETPLQPDDSLSRLVERVTFFNEAVLVASQGKWMGHHRGLRGGTGGQMGNPVTRESLPSPWE